MIILLLLFFMNIVERELEQIYKYVLRGFWIWEKRFFRDFFPSLLQCKTGIMSHISQDTSKKKKKVCDRNSHFLAQENFSKLPWKVEQRCFSLLWSITDTDYICMDEVDIANPCARVMQWIHKIHDSSQKRIVNGFLFHCVSIRGIPVIMEQEDLRNKTKNEYFWKIIMRLKKYTTWKGTLLLDAWYDAKSYIAFLEEQELNFIIRAKRERMLYNTQGESLGKMKSFSEWVHEVYLKQADSSLTRVYFYVKQFPEYTEPLRIYSNTPDRDILEYKKRWEIENIFKTMKQEYNMESIQAGSLQVMNNLVASIQMAVAFAHHLYGIQEEHQGKWMLKCGRYMQTRWKKFHWREWGNMNPNMYIRFLWEIVRSLYKNKRKQNYKKHINTHPKEIAQQRLFSMRQLKKSGGI